MWRHRLGSADARAVAVLLVLPVLFFVVPALAGHPAITGDNLIQNFPLRVLTGRQLREGHLPLWNPYIWSGSPLLGGLNSGSFYPLTFLFAVLRPVAAWVANLLGVYWAGGLSMYALVRQYRLRPLAGVLAAITFDFSGTMSGQFVHLGVIEGMAWAPLLVLALLRLSWAVLGTGPVRGIAPSGDGAELDRGGLGAEADVARVASPWPWVALLAAVVGLEALTGEPRAMAETEVVGAAVAAWLVLRPYGATARRVAAGARARFLALAAIGGAWGVALAASELAPGWSFIRASQRAVESYQFFGTGSLRPAWTLLLLVPDLFGGAGLFGQQRWFNNYNLPEVTGYVGLLPLAAALVLLTRSFGRRRSAMASDWGMWLALGGLGLVLAWGSFTPFGHIGSAIPLFGKTRLQSRSLEIVDLALAVLLAFFLDRLLSGRGGALAGWRRALAAVPAAGAALLCLITLAAPVPVETWLHASSHGAPLARRLWPWFLAEIVVAAAVGGLVVGWRRLGSTARARVLVAVVVADLALFVAATSTAPAAPPAMFEPQPAAATAVVGTHGRFAIVDTAVSHLETLTTIGQPDLNAFSRTPSVQGYGSILSVTYGDATGTHTLDTIDACALARGVFRPLRLSTLVVFPGNLVSIVGGTPDFANGGRRHPAFAAAYPPTARPATPAVCPGAPAPGTDARRVLYLGWPEPLVRATVVLDGTPGAHARPTVAVVGRRGRVTIPKETVRRTKAGWAVHFAQPEPAAGIVVRGAGAPVSLTTTVTSSSGTSWAFEGTLQSALDTAAWRFTGSYRHTFGIFAPTSRVRPPVWLAVPAAGSSVHQVRATDWGTTVDRVDATRAVTVVWSEAYLPGWRAELTPAASGAATGARGSRPLTVEPHGLLQSVRVPAGTWLLTFSYRPRALDLGLAGSLAALAGFAVFGVLAVVRRRRARPAGPRRAGRREVA